MVQLFTLITFSYLLKYVIYETMFFLSDNEDLMEERTRWKPLIPIDLPPPLVEPGKDSREKDIQYAREKGILQALYFNRSMYVLFIRYQTIS